MEYSTLKLRIENNIAEIELNQPHKANALDGEAWRSLEVVFDTLKNDDDVYAIVLSGLGKHFSAGIDLNFFASIQSKIHDSCPAKTRENLRALILSLQAPINAIESCPKPVIAVIHGACVGAGLDIVAACDIRYASQDAFFSIKEIDIGIVADLGSLQRLPKIIPEGMVREMAFTGRNIDAQEAERIGLVNKVLDKKEDAMMTAKETATLIAKKSPLAIRGTKAILNHSRDHTVADGLEHVATWNAAMLLSEGLFNTLHAAKERK